MTKYLNHLFIIPNYILKTIL